MVSYKNAPLVLTDGEANYCSALLRALTARESSLKFVKPTIQSETFDNSFSDVQSKCPDMPLNEHLAYLQNVQPRDVENLSLERRREFGTSWFGTKTPKLFEIKLGQTQLHVFYAEGYFSDDVAARSVKRLGESGRRFGYALTPGYSAEYTFFDLGSCRRIDMVPAHEPVYHLTNEPLPNRSALAEYQDAALIIDLSFDATKKKYRLDVDKYSPPASAATNACRYIEK